MCNPFQRHPQLRDPEVYAEVLTLVVLERASSGVLLCNPATAVLFAEPGAEEASRTPQRPGRRRRR